MPYTNNPSGSATDRVRLYVGDISTSTGGEFLANADCTHFISVTSNEFTAAQLAANSLAALFQGSAASASGGGWVEKTVGDLKIKKADAAQTAASYRTLSRQLGLMAARGLSPYAGGISISDKQDVEGDADRVRPAFVSRLFDNPAATGPSAPAVST